MTDIATTRHAEYARPASVKRTIDEAAAAIEELTAALRAIRNRAAETAPTHATRDIVKWCDHAISKYGASNG